MKTDGSQTYISYNIAAIIQNYMNAYGIKSILDPFCGYPYVLGRVNSSLSYAFKYAGDINPYLIALLRHLQDGRELPERIAKEEFKKAQMAFIRSVRENHYLKYVDGYDSWLIGCHCMLDTRHKNFERPNTDQDYQIALNQMKRFVPLLQGIRFRCCDYMEWDKYLVSPLKKRSVVYCDYPDERYVFPWDVWFMKNEFFNWADYHSERHLVFISGKEAPKDFEVIYNHETKTIGYEGEKLFLHRRWVIE